MWYYIHKYIDIKNINKNSMKNPNQWASFISKAFFSLVALFILFQTGGTVLAQEENSSELNFMKNPDITIRDVTIEQGKNEGDEKIAGTFTIYTLEPKYNGDLYYEVSLVRVKDENQDAGDTDNQLVIYSSFPESSPINLDQGKHKVFNYSLNIPENIWAGLFLVKIKLYMGSGALISSGHSIIDLKGQGKFLEIIDKFIEPVFKENDKIYFGVTALNSNTENMNARANINIRKENRFGELVKNFNTDQFEIPAGNEVEKKFELKDLKQGLYSVSLQLANENGASVSNVVYDKFMVEGENALLRILEINPDKLAYANGDTAEIGIKIGILQSGSQSALETDLTVKLIGVEGNKTIGEKTEKVFIAGSERTSSVEIPVKGDLEKYKISVALSQNGKTISEKEFQSFSSGQSNEAEVLNVVGKAESDGGIGGKIGARAGSWKYGLLAGAVIILAAAFAFVGRRYFKNKKLLALFLVSGAALLFMFNAGEAQAAGTLQICVYGKLYDSDRGFYNEVLSNATVYWNGSVLNHTGNNGCVSGPLAAGTHIGNLTAGKASYESGGVDYHFYDSAPINPVIIRDNRTTRINFYLTAKNGGVRFYTYDCESTDAIGNATMHFESVTVNTDGSGHHTLNERYPGIYRYLYASKTGYANSDANNIPISSEAVYSGSHARFCLKKLKGSMSGRVTVCGSPNQGVQNAHLYVGATDFGPITDSSGRYSIQDIAVGTYSGVSFGGVAGFNKSASQTVEIKPNANTVADFCLRPSAGSLTYTWASPVEGESFSSYVLGSINYSFFVNNPTVSNFSNATTEFLLDGEIKGSVTKDVTRLNTTAFNYNHSLFSLPVGQHTVGVKFYWNKTQYLDMTRTINVEASGRMDGNITDCKTEQGVSGARVNYGSRYATADNSGHYRSGGIQIGTLRGVYASENNYENSASQDVLIEENRITRANFCMNKKTGSLVGSVIRNGTRISNASIFWNDPAAGANNVLLGKTNARGFYGFTLDVGDYNGLYATAAGRKSGDYSRTINANSTTTLNFIISNSANQRPVAFIDQPVSNQSIGVGNSVSFTGHGTDSDGSIVGYEWRVGNCNTGSRYSTLASFTRNSNAVGSYRVYFRVRDNRGAWSVNCPSRLITVGNIAVDGACGSADGGFFGSAPSSDLCSAGTPSIVAGSGPWTWTCAGLNGGSTTSCSANKIVVDGACGSADGGFFSSDPSSNLCDAGVPSAVAGSGPWSWTCVGLGGGATVSCSAQKSAEVENWKEVAP